MHKSYHFTWPNDLGLDDDSGAKSLCWKSYTATCGTSLNQRPTPHWSIVVQPCGVCKYALCDKIGDHLCCLHGHVRDLGWRHRKRSHKAYQNLWLPDHDSSGSGGISLCTSDIKNVQSMSCLLDDPMAEYHHTIHIITYILYMITYADEYYCFYINL
jgi:hypothetical protein